MPHYTQAQHALIGKEPNAKRATAWKNELTPRQIEIFENLTGDFLNCLGYMLCYGNKAIPMTKLERRFLRMQEMLKRHVINKFKYLYRSKRAISDQTLD